VASARSLLPQQLFWYACADDEAKMRSYGLTDCIECGCCDLVCPSHIPLTADFRIAKLRIRELEDERARAERAKQRFESRTVRLEREQLQRAQELLAQKEAVKKAGSQAIEEILERSKKPDEDEQ
jgi:electron transport complex protein RnfC